MQACVWEAAHNNEENDNDLLFRLQGKQRELQRLSAFIPRHYHAVHNAAILGFSVGILGMETLWL